jgi:RNA polymerase sigma-70 factor (ECF subfamily)
MVVVHDASIATTPNVASQLEQHRVELTAFCYRMLGSVDAEDAVQETLIRAWRGFDRFEGRAALRSWLYRIAANVCFDMLEGRKRRARPMDLGPAREPIAENLNTLPEVTWIEPMPDTRVVPDGDPAEVTEARETVRLAFVAALQHLPPKQRAVLILREVLRWKASEVAELLETSVVSVNSALQRARATLEARNISATATAPSVDAADAELLARYVAAFERYDMEALTALIHEDATQSMPPFDMWLSGRDDILSWWVGPGIGCRGSRVIPVASANGAPAFGQYKPSESGEGYEPWALQVLEIEDGKIVEFTFFLDTKTVFPLFGLPLAFEEGGQTPRGLTPSERRPYAAAPDSAGDCSSAAGSIQKTSQRCPSGSWKLRPYMKP